MKYVVKLTMKECEEYDLVVCKHCGYRSNNHFSLRKVSAPCGLPAGESACAHAPCPGYEPRFRVGMVIKKAKR